MKKLNKDNKGFSLVELLVVIAIMVVLVGVLAPTLLGNIEKSRVSSDIQTLDSVASAIQNTLATESAYTAATNATTGYTTPTKVNTVVKATVADSDDAFIKVLHEYLASMPTLKGSTADVANMYFSVNATNGQVTVWVAADATAPGATPTGTASGTAITGVLAAKNINYIVVR